MGYIKHYHNPVHTHTPTLDPKAKNICSCNRKHGTRDQHSDQASKATAYKVSISCGHRCQFHLLLFWSSSLLVHLRGQQKMASVPRVLPPMWVNYKKLLAPDFNLIQAWPL